MDHLAPEGERNPICVQTWLKVSFNYVSIIGLLTDSPSPAELLILLTICRIQHIICYIGMNIEYLRV